MEKFIIDSKNSFLDALNVSESDLYSAISVKKAVYHKSEIPKANGKLRTLYCIDSESNIYKLQKVLINKIFSDVCFPDFVYGFIRERSYFDYLVQHCSDSENQTFLRLDIENFFDSIKLHNAYKALNCCFPYLTNSDEKEYIIKSIIEICTYKYKFVQGAVTSPFISNAVFKPIDLAIKDYCNKNNIIYTRYADDMLFSGQNKMLLKGKFVQEIESIIGKYSFKLNRKKILRMKGEISLNGYVVGREIRFSRKRLHDINKLIFDLQSKSSEKKLNLEPSHILNVLRGYKSYLIQYLKYASDDKKEKISKKISVISELIQKQNMLSDNTVDIIYSN